ncbi:MAG: hypothetical protein CM1200mP20_02490 [Pseudomonadota bacterium]|nr:MAG: hypothetical protein CM1200mP20_02490 [Pseudomonadota bacterium]
MQAQGESGQSGFCLMEALGIAGNLLQSGYNPKARPAPQSSKSAGAFKSGSVFSSTNRGRIPELVAEVAEPLNPAQVKADIPALCCKAGPKVKRRASVP